MIGVTPSVLGVQELIALAKDMRAANARREALGLTEDELAFYHASRRLRDGTSGFTRK